MSTKLLLEEWLKNRNEQISEYKSLRSRQRHSILTIGEMKLREAQLGCAHKTHEPVEAEGSKQRSLEKA